MLKFLRELLSRVYLPVAIVIDLIHFFVSLPFMRSLMHEMREIEMGLPTVWSTREEIATIIQERHKETLEKWSRNWFATSLVLIKDPAKLGILNQIASGLPSALRQDFLFAATFAGLLDSLFADSKIHQSNIAVAHAFFFPAGEPIELRAKGGTKIGRTFVLPSPSLTPEEHEKARTEQSVTLTFIQRRGRGKKKKPPMETSRKMTPILTT